MPKVSVEFWIFRVSADGFREQEESRVMLPCSDKCLRLFVWRIRVHYRFP